MRALTLLALLVVGCNNGKDGDDTGGGERPDGGWEDLPEELIGVANWDDDDSDGTADWDQAGVTGDDDLFSVTLHEGLFVDSDSVDVSLEGSTDSVRVYLDGAVILDETTTTTSIAIDAAGSDLQVEFDGLLTEATLSLSGGGETAEIALQSAPLILNNHLQPGELEVAMRYDGFDGNRSMMTSFSDALGDNFETFDLQTYEWDVWIQDEIEFATLVAPGHRLDVVIDSIRSSSNTALGQLPGDELYGPDTAVVTWGSGMASSQDSFGNMEVTPPITVDGVDYPFGRIYWGEWYGDGPDEELATMLDAQGVQAPFQLDVSWLCVGHVDEFVTFVPDTSSDKGFRVLIANTDMGWEFLEEMGADYDLPRKYQDGHGFDNVGEMLDDEELQLYNEEIQPEIDASREILKQEAGLDDDDFIDIPALFEAVGWCRGTAVSLIPGTINMTIYEDDAGSIHAFIADPFFRGDDDEQDDDPFISEISPLLPTTLEQHWVDDWSLYHLGMGEVHCGSNTRRTPVEDWWDAATHLVGGER